MMVLILLVLVSSCTQDGDSGDYADKLTDYCIRECVLETGASEICDTECRCAAQKVLSENSEVVIKDLVQNISRDQPDGAVSIKNALAECKVKGN